MINGTDRVGNHWHGRPNYWHFSNGMAVMERDRRLTGLLRGQTDSPIAPDGFELSNAWKVNVATSEVFETDTDVGALSRQKDGWHRNPGWQKDRHLYIQHYVEGLVVRRLFLGQIRKPNISSNLDLRPVLVESL